MNNCCRCSSSNGNFSNNVLSSQDFTNSNNSNTCGCSTQNLNNNCENNFDNRNLSESLNDCVGRRCICEFDTSDGLESKTGILERIGNNYLILRSLNSNRIIYCNTCNLMFVTIIY